MRAQCRGWSRIGSVVGALVIATGALRAGEAQKAQPLPKIRVAADARTFCDETGKPFVPLGVTYYRPGTGWAPQVWKQFDPEATRKDFARMKAFGVNCVRVFLSFGSFYRRPGVLDSDGLAKFDQFLSLAEGAGIYVHPTGPDHWEGPPDWGSTAIEDEQTLSALESFWKLFAARYRGRHVVFAYDLRNEPELTWDSPALRRRWSAWLKKKYGTPRSLEHAWGTNAPATLDAVPVPSYRDAPGSRPLLDYQTFREGVAEEWTRRQAAAVKSVDPDALVTVGLIQWSVPSLLPGQVRYYSAFRPDRQARYLDFLEIHFYPFARGAYDYHSEADEEANLAYLEGVVREVARPGKPVVLAEFGWYGGGKPRFGGGKMPAASEEEQARYCRRVVETSAGFAVGWLNWGFYDQPEATDCSQFTGLVTATGETKAWGDAFRQLASRFAGRHIAPAKVGERPSLDWDACLTSTAAAKDFREAYLRSFEAGTDARPAAAAQRE